MILYKNNKKRWAGFPAQVSMRLCPEERKLMNKAVKQGKSIKLVADFFSVTRQTVWYWKSETLNSNFKDLPRKTQPSKITVEVEVSILAMRSICQWGTARIQQGLMNLPDFMRNEIGVMVQGVMLSRTAINNILKKHGINGYRRKSKTWKFFRASKPNELWQVDLKGHFTVQGKKYWIVVTIDDYSRYILNLQLLDHAPNCEEILESLKPLIDKHHPEGILTDNSPFGESWKVMLAEVKIIAHFAHPYYPQDKGKVERTIRNLSEEFINLLKAFPHWLKGRLEEWRNWFNEKRYHRGIKGYPSELYVKL